MSAQVNNMEKYVFAQKKNKTKVKLLDIKKDNQGYL